MADLIGGVEGGGTKFLAAVAHRSGEASPTIVDRFRTDTTADPRNTLEPVAHWLSDHSLAALGVASFGPLDLKAGRLRITPKPGWSKTDLVTPLVGLTEGPLTIDTDVNAAALAEWLWGAARGVAVALYVTVGTGIGGGAVIDGQPLHGLGHPEMGHITVARRDGDAFEGTCPIHGDCLEGMASATAIGARCGRPAVDIDAADPVWETEAYYLGQGLAGLTLTLAPEVIVLGGGVTQRPGLVDEVASHLNDALGIYVPTPRMTLPTFGQEAGLIGALALADRSLPAR